MMRLSRLILPAVLSVAVAAGMAQAENAPATHKNMPSAESIQRLQDGQIAMAVTALKMTDDQLKLWTPIEALIKAQQANRLKRMQDFAAAHQDGAPRPTLADRLDKMSEQMAQRAEQMKAFATAFRPFYVSLSDAQKEVVGPLLAKLRGGHEFGRHWAMNRGHGDMQQ